MRQFATLMAAATLVFGGLHRTQAQAAPMSPGEKAYQACAECHLPGADSSDTGPSLNGVFGRRAGSLEDYHYSPAMRRAGFVWDAARLHAFIADPKATVPGTKMPPPHIDSPADIDAIVGYLKTLK